MTPAPVATAVPAPTRVLTIPNAITCARLLCIPLFLWLLFAQDDRASAAWLLGIVGATDWVDGYAARHLHQVSELGKVLDPTADRLVFIICGGAILIDGSLPTWFGVAVLAREIVVGGALVLLTLFGMRRFDVKWVGKAGTFALMFAMPAFLLSASDSPLADFMTLVAWGFGIPGLVLSYYAAITYVPEARRALREGREARHT
ncbi:MAG TPA: CDP-alcohol phosphatidyltransferase family protein [Acidimicrobiales bacterium]|nr:CDP-alcohol phosphatidyltransferase family protein [Acidimicrobiales bacterium]